MVLDPVAGALDALAAGIDAVRSTPWTQADAAGQITGLERLEELRRRLDYAALVAIRDVEASGAPSAVGAPSMTALLRARLRLSPADATGRMRAMKSLCDRVSLTGEPIPAALPQAGAAAEAGVIGPDHVRVIVGAMADLPSDLAPDVRTAAEATLVADAEVFGPVELRKIATRLTHHLAARPPKPEDVAARRGLVFHDDLPGMVTLRGRCSTATAEIIRSALDPLATPRAQSNGVTDGRTGTQRYLDALEELAKRHLDTATLPGRGGERPHVTLTLDETTWRTGNGLVETGWAGPIPVDQIDWMLCDATITPIRLDQHGIPRRIGAVSRTIPGWLRRTVTTRDRGCVFPGCDRPAAWCDLHHITPWHDGGPHQAQNLATLCGYHHKLVHTGEWQVQFIHDLPHLRPSRWIDPQQKPLRNHIHDLHRNLPMRT